MNELIFPGKTYQDLAEEFARHDVESCAIAFATVIRSDHIRRLLVTDIRIAPPDVYTKRTRIAAQLNSVFIGRLAKQARNEKKALVFLHSHISSVSSRFSNTDNRGEQELKVFLDRRWKSDHAAVVIDSKGCRARMLGTQEVLNVFEAGRNFRQVSIDSSGLENVAEHFDRQVRAFGIDGQKHISRLRIAIVGLGGTGSIVAMQLAHLGVEHYTLIDPDSVEVTNLNRIAGATVANIGEPKVEVAARQILNVRPLASIDLIRDSVLYDTVACKPGYAHCIFCCTDSHGSRALLNQIAYQYYVPCIDMGISIGIKESRVTHIAGRVQMLAPGLSCLTCGNMLDPDAVRRDFMSDEELTHDPYFLGAGVPQPAVISLNSTMASLAVTMWLSAIVGIGSEARLLLYDGLRGRVKAATQSPVAGCVVCSRGGVLGRGSEAPLPTRPK